MAYNLTTIQKDLLREIVAAVRDGKLDEEFTIIWTLAGPSFQSSDGFAPANKITRGKLEALMAEGLLHLRQGEYTTHVTLTGIAYDAVESDFETPDTSFLTQLTPLADLTNFDDQLKKRVLPILGAGAADPMLWDSAVRTASVILEERLREVGGVTDGSIGKVLVNKVFGTGGTLTAKFTQESERESYRDVYAGIVRLVRNPSAHRLIDPTPEEGGVLLVFVDLLLSKLEALRGGNGDNAGIPTGNAGVTGIQETKGGG